MGSWSNIRKEFKALNRLAVVSIISNCLDASFGLVDIIMLGRLGRGNLSAGVVALAFYNIAWFFVEGVLSAQDTLLARAYAVKDQATLRYWCYIAFAVVIILDVAASALFGFAPLILSRAFEIRLQTIVKATEFILILLPAFWLHSWYKVIQKYYQVQNFIVPQVLCALIGISVNIVGNALFMYAFGMGIVGCGMATIAARVVMLLTILRFTRSIVDESLVLQEALSVGWELRRSAIRCAHRTAHSISTVGRRGRDGANYSRVSAEDSVSSATTATAGGGGASGDGCGGDDDDEGGIEMAGITGSSGSGGGSEKGIGKGTKARKKKGHKQSGSSSASASDTERVVGAETEVDAADADEAPLLGGTDPTRNQASSAFATGTSRRNEGGNGRRSSALANLVRFLLLGLPGGFVLGLDSWIYELLTIVVAQMGTNAVDTHQILIVIISYAYLSLPFAISVAATLRISRLLSSRKPQQARITAMLSIIQNSVLITIVGVVVYLLRKYVAYVFTRDEDIADRVRGLMEYGLGFLGLYSLSGSAQGVLRATAHQWDILGFTFLALWVVGGSLGMYLTFVVRPTYNLRGVWIGLVVGMALLAFTMLLQVVLLDWEKEARKAAYRLQRARSKASTSGSGAGAGAGTGAATRGDGVVGAGRKGTEGHNALAVTKPRRRNGKSHRSGSGEYGAESDDDGNLDGSSIHGGSILGGSLHGGSLHGGSWDTESGQDTATVGEYTDNPMLRSATAAAGILDADQDVALPALGSRSLGGLPLSFLQQDAEEELLEELAQIEFGESLRELPTK